MQVKDKGDVWQAIGHGIANAAPGAALIKSSQGSYMFIAKDNDPANMRDHILACIKEDLDIDLSNPSKAIKWSLGSPAYTAPGIEQEVDLEE